MIKKKSLVYLLIAVLLLVIPTIIISQSVPNPGHSADEILVWVESTGSYMTLQDAATLFFKTQESPVPGGGISSNVVDIEGTNGWISGTTCAVLSDGKVECTGYNGNGELGLGDTLDRTKFTEATIADVDQLIGSHPYFCAVLKGTEDGKVKCWGRNHEGNLGIKATCDSCGCNNDAKMPTYVINGDGTTLTNVKKLAMKKSNAHSEQSCGFLTSAYFNYAYTCALLKGADDGKVKCWGYNGYGQLGVGDLVTRPNATLVPGISNAIDIKIGGFSSGGFTCALLADKTVKCWGYNGFGQLGDGTAVSKNTPTLIPGLTNVKAIELAPDDWGWACAIIDDGTVKCWGWNGDGNLGVGDITNRANPTLVSGIGGSDPKAAKLLLMGSGHDATACALLDNGQIKCWGQNNGGQVGDGTTTYRYTPTLVSGIGGSNPKATGIDGIEYGRSIPHVCALLEDKTVKCWGYNGFGQLGDGTTVNKATPTLVKGSCTGGLLCNVKKVETMGDYYGGARTCAILEDYTMRCWGHNGYGQLGTGDKTQSLIPVEPA
jgi:alpha-tubulin suppressor-like RCC1 family protein